MKLTGKAREAFGEWIKENYSYFKLTKSGDVSGIDTGYGRVDCLATDALIVEFLDEQGVLVALLPNYANGYDYPDFFTFQINGVSMYPLTENSRFKTRPEATSAAIEKANEILNNRLK